MDTLAHGLWGGIGFYSRGFKSYAAAFIIGMAPDLLSFGPFFLTHPVWVRLRLAGKISGPPPLSLISNYVFYTYDVTHSLVIWAALFGLLWFMKNRPLWLLLAWALHIVCDIPTHNSRYFPTPYLWPIPAPRVEGISWATPWFMFANYSTLLAAYAGIWLYMQKRKQNHSSKSQM